MSDTKAKSESRVESMHKLLAVVDEALDQAGKLGFSPEELFLTLYARTQASPSTSGAKRDVKALFIECSRPELTLFSGELMAESSVVVCSSLVEDKIRSLAPKSSEIIVDNKRIDKSCGAARAIRCGI